MLGWSISFATRCSPFPFRKLNRTVDACAKTCPPMGFLGSCTNVIPPEGSAMTWFVMSTAMLYSSLICGNQLGVVYGEGAKGSMLPSVDDVAEA
jgi:hypothetical protein